MTQWKAIPREKIAITQDTAGRKFWPRVDQGGGYGDCWLWLGRIGRNGYGDLTILGRSFYAHRVSFLLCMGLIPKDLQVCHHCDSPPCVNPLHLYVGTAADNAADRERRGRTNHTYNRSKRKLTPADVIKVRKLYAEGKSLTDLAEPLSVHRETIRAAVERRTYKEVL